MRAALSIIDYVAHQTNRVILFHSGTGKDSIALLHLLASKFENVFCIYMYVVKDLDHVNKYINWAEKKYQNCQFIQIPHFNLTKHLRQEGAKIKRETLGSITSYAKIKYKCEYACFGFKQSDSLNRRLMLKTYSNCYTLNEKTKNFYPLSNIKNKDVERFIQENALIPPLKYGIGRSQGVNPNDIDYLNWCKNNHPSDFRKTIEQFPNSELVIFEHENKGKY